jgi:hypothetical protein
MRDNVRLGHIDAPEILAAIDELEAKFPTMEDKLRPEFERELAALRARFASPTFLKAWSQATGTEYGSEAARDLLHDADVLAKVFAAHRKLLDEQATEAARHADALKTRQ